jgi:small-conductance mechanosensitive channel
LKTALNIAIWKMFRDNDIRIPYPQREVRIIGGLPGDKPELPAPA